MGKMFEHYRMERECQLMYRNTISSGTGRNSVSFSVNVCHPNMGMHDEEVRERITKIVWNKIVTEAKIGRITVQQMYDIASGDEFGFF